MKKTLLAFCMLAMHSLIHSQQLMDGPEIENTKNTEVSALLDGDNTCFFVYRHNDDAIRSFTIEKYDKETLKQLYAEQLNLPEMEAILSVGSKVYVFYSTFFPEQQLMSVYFRELSPEGKLLPDIGEVLSVHTDNSKYADFLIDQTADKSKFIIKISYKSTKADAYETDFVFLDSKSFKILFTKSVAQKFSSGNSAYQNFAGSFYKDLKIIGLGVSNEGAVYYGYTYTRFNDSGIKESMLNMVMIPANSMEAKTVTIPLIPEGPHAYDEARFGQLNLR